MKRKRIEANNLSSTEAKNINEIVKEKNANKIKLLTEKDTIVSELKNQKKQYQKKRLAIIADNNKKLLKARIKHNEEVKQIKLDAENKHIETPNAKIKNFFNKFKKEKK